MAAVTAVRQEFSATTFGTAAFTTGAFTPPNNSLLTVFVEVLWNSSGNPGTGLTFTDSLGSTWTNQGSSHQDVLFGHSVTCFTTPITTGASMTVSCDHGADSIYQYVVTAVAVTGYDTGTPVGGIATVAADIADGAETMTLSAAPTTDDITFFMDCIDDSGSAAGPTMGAGSWTSIYNGVSNLGSALQYRTADTSATVSITDVYTGGGAFDKGIALSIVVKGLASAAAQADFPFMPGRFDNIWPGELQPFYVQGPDLYWVEPAAVVSTADQSTTGYLDANTVPYAIVTADRSVVGYTPAGITPYATVTHNASVAGLLELAADPRATVTHDTSLAGWLPAAVDLRATASHDTSLVGYLPAGIVPYVGTYTTGFATIGYLPIGADLRATVTADRTVTARLDASITPYATVSHNATVVGYVTIGAVAYALVSGAADFNTFGVLYLGTFPRAAVTADRTASGLLVAGTDLRAAVSHTASVAGFLTVGTPPVAVVTHQVQLAGYLPLAVVQFAPYGLFAITLPPVTDTLRAVKGYATIVTAQPTATLRLRATATIATADSTATLWVRPTASGSIE